MRTALLCWSYPPARNGLANAAAEIAGALAENGHAPVVVTLDRSGRTVEDGVTVVGCAPGPMLARLRRFAGLGHLVAPLQFWRAVRRLHREQPLALAEATNWYAPGAAIALFGPVPLVTRCSTPASITGAGARSRRDRIDHRVAVWLEQLSARRSAGLISNTLPHAAAIARRYKVAPPGPGHAVIGLSLPQRIRTRGAAASYPPAGNGPATILFVGRAEARKGHAELLDAAETLAAEAEAGTGPEFKLVMVGIGAVQPLAPALMRRLECLRDLPEDALYALFARAHLVAAPSRYESFGLVYQEAMAFGRPLLACVEDASARRFVGDAGAGLLAERCDGAAIAVVMRRMLGDPVLLRALHLASRAASGAFNRASLASDTMALYRHAVSAGRSERGLTGAPDRVPARGLP